MPYRSLMLPLVSMARFEAHAMKYLISYQLVPSGAACTYFTMFAMPNLKSTV